MGITEQQRNATSHASILIQARVEAINNEQSAVRLGFARDVIAPALARAFDAKRVWLFGSVARNTASKDSDVDLLIEGGEGMTAKARLSLAYDVVADINDLICGCDVVVLTASELEQKSSIPSIKSMLADRRLIYERQS